MKEAAKNILAGIGVILMACLVVAFLPIILLGWLGHKVRRRAPAQNTDDANRQPYKDGLGKRLGQGVTRGIIFAIVLFGIGVFFGQPVFLAFALFAFILSVLESAKAPKGKKADRPR